jgi:hypothetical protein
MPRLFLALLLALASNGVEASYSVEVNRLPELENLQRIAVVPGVCPADFDCLWAERVVIEKLVALRRFRFEPSKTVTDAKRNLGLQPYDGESSSISAPVIISAETVRQKMFEAGIIGLDEANRRQVAESLGVDGFLQVIVHGSSKETSGSVGVLIGTIVTMVPSDVSKGGVEVRVISADEGKLLLRGEAHGSSEFRSPKGVLGKMIGDILRRGYEH